MIKQLSATRLEHLSQDLGIPPNTVMLGYLKTGINLRNSFDE
jgi:hypothetical protein